MKYWNESEKVNCKLVQEYSRLWGKYIPMSGSSFNRYGDLILAASRLMYDFYNNGWGCNNKLHELYYLHKFGFMEELTGKHLVGLAGLSTAEEDYMDSEMDKIVLAVLEAEKQGSLGVPDIPAGDTFFDLDFRAEWTALQTEADQEFEEEEE